MVLLKSNQKLQLGDSAPDFVLKGTDSKGYSLADFDAKALLIIFMCNHCPFVQSKFDTVIKLQEDYKDKGLVVVGINPNDPEEYPEDNFESMQAYYEEKGFNFIYLQDNEQTVAKEYGAVCTPDPFLFDSHNKLMYHGRIDNAMNPEDTPTQHDIREILDAYFAGEEVPTDFRPSQGCSIKWKSE